MGEQWEGESEILKVMEAKVISDREGGGGSKCMSCRERRHLEGISPDLCGRMTRIYVSISLLYRYAELCLGLGAVFMCICPHWVVIHWFFLILADPVQSCHCCYTVNSWSSGIWQL